MLKYSKLCTCLVQPDTFSDVGSLCTAAKYALPTEFRFLFVAYVNLQYTFFL